MFRTATSALYVFDSTYAGDQVELLLEADVRNVVVNDGTTGLKADHPLSDASAFSTFYKASLHTFIALRRPTIKSANPL
ncbi:MAG TPA: hypothetical protein VEF34_00655 [Syntrophobacteraceae bacterium]|nr:hypothetical protein [Syntrophobacteraceae bacterium]